MSNGYTVKEMLKQNAAVSCTAGATTAVTDVFRMSGEDSRNSLVYATFSAVSETTGISVALQDSPDGTTFTSLQSANVASVANVETLTFPAFAGATTGDYFVVYDAAGQGWAAYLSKAGIKEVTSITAVGDTAGSLHLKTFILSDSSGTVGFWIDVDNAGGSIPAEASACARAVEITTVTTGMSASAVAGVIATAIDADAQFVAPAPAGAVITVTDAATGARADASASTSGFTVSTTTQGAALATAPTGAIYTALGAAYKTGVDISADTTAAQVAARVETAFDALTGVTSVLVTDDSAANGTMTFTAVQAGVNTTNTVLKNENDSGAGSITAAQTTAGSFTATYELENNVYDGTDTASWPLARVVVITQASDTATCSGVLVSRRL